MLRKNLSTEHTEGTDHRKFIHGGHGGHGSSEFRRNLDGIILGSLRLEILEEILYEMLLRKKSIIGSSEFKRNLNGYFGVASQDVLE